MFCSRSTNLKGPVPTGASGKPSLPTFSIWVGLMIIGIPHACTPNWSHS